jgi:hypothetical protein
MNIYNNLNKQEKYAIIIRKLKEGFLSFCDELLDVFPNNKNLFIQRIISYQLSDTSLYKILKKNININLIEKNDEQYLRNNLYFLKDYEQYLNENKTEKYKYFSFNELCNERLENYNSVNNSELFNDNIDMIWKWIEIIILLIKQIDKINDFN